MHITILGGAGFLGRKVAARLAAEGALGGRPVSSLTLFDLAAPPRPPAPRSRCTAWPATSPSCPRRRSRPAPRWCSTSPPS